MQKHIAALVGRKQLDDDLKLGLISEVDRKRENDRIDKEKQQITKVMNQIEKKNEKSKEKTIEEEVETIFRK